jgi:hypothetical protein
MKKTILTLGIMCLLIGINVIPSTGNMVLKETSLPFILDKSFDKRCIGPAFTCLPKSIDCSKKLYFEGKIAYGLNLDKWWGPCYFLLDDPGNITYLYGRCDPPFLSGGTWTNDWRWICCEYYSGCLWEIDPKTGVTTNMGGGGNDTFNGLAYNPITEKLYAVSSEALYETDIKTGQHNYIGSFNNSGQAIIGIAFDEYGILYGWDVKFEGDSYLYTINVTTGQATQVGSLGMTLCWAQDGAFDFETDTLYLSAYIKSPIYGGYLIECDEDSGNCAIIGQFGDNGEIDALAIPYGWHLPYIDFNWTPTLPKPGETIFFDASASYDPDGHIVSYEWDWDNDGIFDENKTNPTATHSWYSTGNYPINLKVTDNASLNMTKTRKVLVDQSPNPPEIKGPNYVKIGKRYNYTIKGIDPDGDDISEFGVEWGDGSGSGTQGSFPSGTTKVFNHGWYKNGTFIIKARVKDIYRITSDWTEFEVKVTSDKSTSSSPFLRFLERFPLLERLIFYFIK